MWYSLDPLITTIFSFHCNRTVFNFKLKIQKDRLDLLSLIRNNHYPHWDNISHRSCFKCMFDHYGIEYCKIIVWPHRWKVIFYKMNYIYPESYVRFWTSLGFKSKSVLADQSLGWKRHNVAAEMALENVLLITLTCLELKSFIQILNSIELSIPFYSPHPWLWTI